MRKIVIGSGLGLVAAAIPAHGAVLPLATAPAGVSEAGRVHLGDQADPQGVLIGLNKAGQSTQVKAPDAANSQIKMNPYDKMNAEAQLKIKGQSQLKLNGDGLKTGTQIKSTGDSQIKIKSGAQIKTGAAGLLCDGFVAPGGAQVGK
jgi:hypothetical protein